MVGLPLELAPNAGELAKRRGLSRVERVDPGDLGTRGLPVPEEELEQSSLRTGASRGGPALQRASASPPLRVIHRPAVPARPSLLRNAGG
jgi:hypothetical protein